MLPQLEQIKGVHPGALLKREMKQKSISGIELSNAIGEHPQTINAIINERRGMNPKLSLKLGRFLGTSDDYFMLVQASYEVMEYIKSITSTNNEFIKSLPKSMFWDIDMSSLNSETHKRFIIQRVLERGGTKEIKSLIAYYGKGTINQELIQIKDSFIPDFKRNVEKYIAN